MDRILIASIRNLGNCPCPRCLIPLNRVHNLGMARDITQRATMTRVDDSQRRSIVFAARRIIYELNLQVNSTAVENLLREISLVPTVVCDIIRFSYSTYLELIFGNWFCSILRMPSQKDYPLLASNYFGCCSQT
jgi:hypothetical protein